MIADVTLECTTWNELPRKFEAGTPDVCSAIALGARLIRIQATCWRGNGLSRENRNGDRFQT